MNKCAYCNGDVVAGEEHDLLDCGKVLRDTQHKYRSVLEGIYQWSQAYPIESFPEPDMEKARELLEAGGIQLGAVSARAMRHVVKQVGQMVNDALELEEETAVSPEPADRVFFLENIIRAARGCLVEADKAASYLDLAVRYDPEWTIDDRLETAVRTYIKTRAHLRDEQRLLADLLKGRTETAVPDDAPIVPIVCPYCGDDRTGKGSLIFENKAFCSEDHFEEWRAALMEKRNEP